MNVVPFTSPISSPRDISRNEALRGFTRLFSDLAVQTDRIEAMGGNPADIVKIKASIVAAATHLLNANVTFITHVANSPKADGE